MSKYHLMLLLLFSSVCLYGQRQIVKEEVIGNDTVVWETQGVNRFFVSLKGDNVEWKGKQRVPTGMNIETYEGRVSQFLSYMNNNKDSLFNVYFSFFPEVYIKNVPSKNSNF